VQTDHLLELKLGFKAGLSQLRPFSRRQPLPGIISSNRISAPDSNIFDCAALAGFLLGHRINPLFVAPGLTHVF
jgi:hypothetical protein